MNETVAKDWYLQMMDHQNFVPVAGMVVGIVAIVCATIVVIAIPKLLLAHRQRMAMIDRGMHPDGYIEEFDEAVSTSDAPGAPPRPINSPS